MSLKRIFRVFIRDIKSSLRDFMIVYVLVAPFLMAGILMAVAPETDEITINFAVTDDMEDGLIEAFESYGEVEILDSNDELEDRIDQADEVLGIVKENNEYKVILQGNETKGFELIPVMIMDEYFNNLDQSLNVNLTDIGREDSVIRREGSLFLLLFTLIAPGLLVGLNLIEEKESNTMSALDVSPLGKGELIIGKSLFAVIVSIIQLLLMFIIFGYNVNNLMVLLLWIPGILSGLLLGFLTGVIAEDQVSAIGIIKFSFFPVLVSFLGSIFIPVNWHWTLYWSPYFWLYKVFSGMVLNNLSWIEFSQYTGLILLISVIFLLITKNKIKRGLVSK